MTNKFDHNSHRFEIGADTTFKTGFPVLYISLRNGTVDSVGIGEAENISLTKEKLETIRFSTESNVNIPAGKAITKSAIIKRVDLKFPWNAKIVNKLGTVYTIGGVWYGQYRLFLRYVESNGC